MSDIEDSSFSGGAILGILGTIVSLCLLLTQKVPVWLGTTMTILFMIIMFISRASSSATQSRIGGPLIGGSLIGGSLIGGFTKRFGKKK